MKLKFNYLGMLSLCSCVLSKKPKKCLLDLDNSNQLL